MKKTLGFLVLLAALLVLMGTALAEDIPIDAAHFPDANFRAYVAEQCDENNDGILSEQEQNGVDYIDVTQKNITSLQGIEYFPDLTYLSCNSNQLTSLDVSANPALTYLDCDSNQLTSLDVSANTALTDLSCFSNQLTSLDVSANTALQSLECSLNQLTSLDVSANTALKFLFCDDNQLTSLDVSANPALQMLYCFSNQLTSLDVSANTALHQLYCDSNQLTSLDVSANTALKFLACSSNPLTSLDVSSNTALQELYCSSNQLTSLDVSANSALQTLSCDSNQLTSLDVSANSALQTLKCSSNQLTSLDVSANTALQYLNCGSNQLTSLDVSANTALTYLSCYSNQLTSLDVSANTALQTLYCGSNYRAVTAENGQFDLSTLRGFDVTKASNWNGGEVSGTLLTVPASGDVTYTYDCGNGYSAKFTLNVTVTNLEEAGIPIDAAHFPDANFRAYVTENIDADGNGVLSVGERNAVTKVNVDKLNIASLQGIAYFTALQELSCNYNQMTNLDVSANTALQTLSCDSNQMTSLNVSANTALTYLNCDWNQLTSLDVSANTALTYLSCDHNQMTSLDVSANPALQELYCHKNQLTSLDVSANTALAYLNCSSNQLTSLDVSANPALQELGCDSNQLTSLDVSANTALTYLECYSNQLTSLDVSANTALTYLECYSNQLTSLDVSANTALTYLNCFSNQKSVTAENGQFDLSTLRGFDAAKASDWNGGSVSGTVLTVPASGKVTYTYDCGSGKSAVFTLNVTVTGNEIPVDAAHFPDDNFRAYVMKRDWNNDGILSEQEQNAVTSMNVSEENITSLQGIEYFPALQTLYCYSNQLTSLDVSANTALQELFCGSNQLTSLDVSANTALQELGCDSNQLTSLDVSANTALQLLKCYSNQKSVTAENGQFDLSTLRGFDVTKANNWNGGTVSGTILTIPASGDVTYTYDCGNGYSETFTLTVTVTGEPEDDVPVTAVKLDQKKVTLNVGQKLTLNATVSPDNATDKSLKWKTSDKKVATVTSSGKVTAVGVGTAKITATAKDGSGKKATCTVTVIQPVTAIVLDQAEASLKVGESVTLTATVSPDDATNKALNWESSDTAIATVDAEGKVTAIGAGSATITAAAQDGSGVTAVCQITVISGTVPVTAVKLDQTKATMSVGQKLTLKATVSPDDATDKAVKWKTSDKNVATVSSSGKVTAVGVGAATITVTAKDGSGKKATCKITVINPVTAIKLNKTKVTLSIGKTVTLKATVSPDDATDKTLKWSSSKKSVAKVSSSGKVTAVSAGTATITAAAQDGSGVKVTCTITVVNPVTAIVLDQAEAFLKVGESVTLAAAVSPDDATNKALNWESSDAAIAAVDAEGKVTAVGVGVAKITASAQDGSGVTAVCQITVSPNTIPVTSVKLDQTKATMSVGQKLTLKATVSPDDATDKAVKWKTSDKKVATVSSSGKVTAVGLGTAKITVTAKDGSGKKATCTITVINPVTSITLNKTKSTLKVGGKTTLKATVSPDDATNPAVKWTSSDTTVAKVSSSGKVTAIGVGTATITAAAQDGSGVKATCKITVKEAE